MDGMYIALIAVGCVLIVGLIGLFCYLSNNLLRVNEYTVISPEVRAEGVKIALISDMHGKEFGKANKKLLKKVAAASPDIIAVTGDIIHKYRKKDIAAAIRAIKGFKKIAPVFYVSGNHEMRSLRYRELKGRLTSAGAVVLDDSSARICGINLHGVNCANIKRGAYGSLIGEDGYNVLLAHLPQYITRYAACGYDLALCGHAHGGQWRVPFTKIGFYSPGQGLFPKYTSGAHVCGGMTEIISRGLGNSECPLRLFNCPELVMVNISNG